MKEQDCALTQDLLPLYLDQSCSEQTARFVQAHLQTCDACRRLHDEMRAGLPLQAISPDLSGERLFRRARRSLAGILLALAVMAGCFAVNLAGAWEGGPAHAGQLAASLCYAVFWGVFSVASRNYLPLIRVSFVISLLTCISAISSLIWRLLGGGGFLAAALSVFASVPFYGLRLFLDWTCLYAAAALLALGWLAYTGWKLRKLRAARRC